MLSRTCAGCSPPGAPSSRQKRKRIGTCGPTAAAYAAHDHRGDPCRLAILIGTVVIEGRQEVRQRPAVCALDIDRVVPGAQRPLGPTGITGSPDAAFTVTTRRSLPTDQIPSHLRSFVGNRIDVRQVEAWEAAAPDGSRVGHRCSWTSPVHPFRLSGRTRTSRPPGRTPAP